MHQSSVVQGQYLREGQYVQQHVIQTVKHACLFKRHQIPWLLDNTKSRLITTRVFTNRTDLTFRKIETNIAVSYVFTNVSDGIRKCQSFVLFTRNK